MRLISEVLYLTIKSIDMIRKYVSVLLFICLTQWLAAQRFEGALIGGVTFAQIDGDRLYGFNKFGFNAGGQVAAILAERWQVSMEISFSQRGSARTSNDDPFSIYDQIQLNYVEVPVLVRFLDWKMHFNAGFSYNRLINFNVIDFRGSNITDLQNYREDNIAVVLGATYFANEHWGFDFKWSSSFLDLLGDVNQGIPWREKWLSLRTLYVF